jgi:hypothetical protein
MADEQKTVESVETPKTENEVVLSQSKLDKLIDKGFSKGATRAKTELASLLGVDSIEQAQELITAKRESDEASKSELDKASELIATLSSTIAGLESDNAKIKADALIEGVIAKNEIKEADYFKHLLGQETGKENFELEPFIEKLRGDKPYLFSVAESKPMKVDSTTNKQALDVSERIKNCTTIDELMKLQREIN